MKSTMIALNAAIFFGQQQFSHSWMFQMCMHYIAVTWFLMKNANTKIYLIQLSLWGKSSENLKGW